MRHPAAHVDWTAEALPRAEAVVRSEVSVAGVVAAAVEVAKGNAQTDVARVVEDVCFGAFAPAEQPLPDEADATRLRLFWASQLAAQHLVNSIAAIHTRVAGLIQADQTLTRDVVALHATYTELGEKRQRLEEATRAADAAIAALDRELKSGTAAAVLAHPASESEVEPHSARSPSSLATTPRSELASTVTPTTGTGDAPPTTQTATGGATAAPLARLDNDSSSSGGWGDEEDEEDDAYDDEGAGTAPAPVLGNGPPPHGLMLGPFTDVAWEPSPRSSAAAAAAAAAATANRPFSPSSYASSSSRHAVDLRASLVGGGGGGGGSSGGGGGGGGGTARASVDGSVLDSDEEVVLFGSLRGSATEAFSEAARAAFSSPPSSVTSARQPRKLPAVSEMRRGDGDDDDSDS